MNKRTTEINKIVRNQQNERNWINQMGKGIGHKIKRSKWMKINENGQMVNQKYKKSIKSGQKP